MTIPYRPFLLAVCALLLSGCTGTMMTRSDTPMEYAETRHGSMFGG